MQTNPRTDTTGRNNIDFPLEQATYWGTQLTGSNGDTVTIHGQFPAARYMALQIYDYNRNVLSAIRDDAIDPDPGQVNPYRSGGGSAQGTYTIQLIFGRQPLRGPAPNTLYAGRTQSIILLYRVYYSNNPDDLTGGTSNPVLPTVTAGGVPLVTCAPRPIISPLSSTVWGRLEQNNFVSVAPALTLPALNPPIWSFQATSGSTPFFPSQDNSYMSAILSRRYLSPPFRYNLAVMRMRAPTFADTQKGVPPYANADMRFWSVCTDEPIATGVTRCISDDMATNVGGFVTFIISDPATKPSDSTLNKWGAEWLAWGALGPADSIYDARGNVMTMSSGAYFYNGVIYRQTVASPAFAASITNLSDLPRQQAQAAMRDYWPQLGYCALQDFETAGPACLGLQQ
jgi:hypothetical protein